jgi:hypothetical protein
MEGFMVRLRWMVVLLVAAAAWGSARAQGTSGPRTSDSSVGYIDSAIPGDVFRFRFDASFDDNRPTRAEFLYPKGGPQGPGLPLPEKRVDFQELSAYLEVSTSDRLSAFVNLPVRLLQPTVNADKAGFSDLDVGFKLEFLQCEEQVATFQFRTYAPTGDAAEGLGTHHVSFEPALLYFQRLTDCLALESELRLWVPVGGTDFAGNILRYGAGLHYDVARTARCLFTPVVEMVGWTMLNGKETVVPALGAPFVEDAAGQTILNVKLGLRVKFEEQADLYLGYGRALTGDRWYSDTFRVEFRLFF